MIGTEILNVINENMDLIKSSVFAVTNALFSLFLYRRKSTTDELQKIKAGKFEEVIEDLFKNEKLTYVELYKAKNFLSIAKKADEYNKRKSQENEKKDFSKDHNLDWFIRFYESAGNISDEELQDLWARLLTGELNRPLSYSLRLIDILKNMTQADAKMFELICSYSFNSKGDYFLPHYDEYLYDTGIEYADIMRMSELGLIFDSGMMTLQFFPDREEGICISNKELEMKFHVKDMNKRAFAIDQYAFTSVGKELASLKSISADDNRFYTFAEILNKKIDDIEFEVISVDDVLEEDESQGQVP